MRKPFWSKVRKRWMFRQGKLVHTLGTDKVESFKRYAELMAGQVAAVSDVSAAKIIDDFLAWSKLHQAESTYENYAYQLNLFKAFVGSIKLKDLKPFHVARWLDHHGWKGNTGNGAVRAAVRPFSWGLKMGVITMNPLAKVERPSATPRECYITPAQSDELLKAAPDEEFRDLLTILRETGCRPQEMRRMEARHFDRQTITFPREESKGKRRQRIIVLTPTAQAVIQRLALKHPTGALFRNTDGVAWKTMAITNRFNRISKKLGFSVSAYVLRHVWVTNALMNGVEPLTVATLAGHASIKMIWSVYQSLQLQTNHMRESALKAVSRAG